MLSDHVIREINNKIEDELGTHWRLSHEEQMKSFARIKELKEILEPTITIETIVEDLEQPSLPTDLTIDLKKIFSTFRR